MLIAASSGYRRGFWLSLTQYLGLVIGVVAGAALALPILDFLGVTAPDARSLGGVVILFVAGTAGSTVGYWVGEPIRLGLLARPGRGQVDSALGAAFSAVAVLGVCWFLGLSFRAGPSQLVATAVQRSAALRALDSIAPRPPAFLARVEAILSGVHFPSAFSGLEPFFQHSYPIPTSVDTSGVRAAQSETVQVVGRGCGGIVFGSGFPVGPDHIVTNAHVVGGTFGTRVHLPDGRVLAARVVLFDPERDVAVLYVPGLSLGALPMAGAGPGTQGAAIGYPNGGPEQVTAAVIDQSVYAQGRDIYEQNLVTRQIWVIEAQVLPGNSGGPLVNLDGQVVGMVFAASTSQPGQAYALTDSEIQPDIQDGSGATQATGVGSCAL